METGTVRFSFSPFNTLGEVMCAADITEHIMKKL
jgi:cysteine sulfinate desulfinase/cysteine desulfurase-like protein